MPSRAATAAQAIASVVSQVDRLWLFLDRFDSVPSYAEHDRIGILRSQEIGDLRANGKFSAVLLEDAPCTFFACDDDIEYPAGYVETLESQVDRFRGEAVVGVHAGALPAVVESYTQDMRVLHRRSGQARAEGVDLLGTDSLAFRTSTLRFDVKEWPDVNMVDLSFARTARERSIPLVKIPRAANWLPALDENQPDSIWASALADDSRQTVLAGELMALPRPRLPRSGLRRLRLRYRTV